MQAPGETQWLIDLLAHATDFGQNYLPPIDPTATADSSINPTSTPTAIDPTTASYRPSAIDPASGAGVWRRGKPGACPHCGYNRSARPLPQASQKQSSMQQSSLVSRAIFIG
jgi:hypothetical protein